MSSETTFPTDVSDAYVIDTVLLELAEDLFFRMLDEGVTGNTVHVKIRYADFTTVSCQETTDLSIRDSRVLFEKAQALFRKKFDRTQPVRLVGLAVHGLKDARSGGQIGLFPDLMGEKRQKVELAVYDLSKKRGKRLVKRARLLDPKDGREE
jgi:DNA polymerase-4